MYSKHLISVSALVLSVAACSSTTASDDDAISPGGSSAKGGQTGSGGAHAGSGGSTGGTNATGGSGAAGGTTATGGSGGSPPATGGSAGQSTGGSGGSGAVATGGAGGTGATGTGGTTPVGGQPGTGGTTAGTGGNPGAGGTGAGGTGAGGGAGKGGGGTGSGGMPNTGGTGGGSGGGTAVKCDNLSLAPTMSGVAKPSGAAGGLKVLDWAGFKGAVSYTFDDNTPSQLQNYSALKATGAHFTWFVVGSWLNGSSNVSGYKNTIADGQEMANHTYSHMSNGDQNDLSKNESFITSNFGVTANTMAAPNCDSSWANVAPSVLFQNRGPCGTGIATVGPRDSTSPFQLPAYLPAQGAAASALTGQYADGKWRIFVIHGFDSQNGTYQPVPIDSVTSAMKSAVTGGYWTEGITNVGAYWQGQKLISATATTSATWTLPAHFPKNMCVRITTTGGTVTQNGQTIPWNDHGYYEIGLDAGQVTVQ